MIIDIHVKCRHYLTNDSSPPSALSPNLCLPKGRRIQPADRSPTRLIYNEDALAWLEHHAPPHPTSTSVITSLPDISELGHIKKNDYDSYCQWFTETARRVIRWIPQEGEGKIIFFQSDIRKDSGELIDKSYLILRACEVEKASLVWHKIVCRKGMNSADVRLKPGLKRATYSHMLCVSRKEVPAPRRAGPDVLADGGFMSWSRAMGQEACRMACRYLLEETDTMCVVDPFCGQGSVLAMANAFGFDAVGVDLSTKRCRVAEKMVSEICKIPPFQS